jgi:hypothetical protein
MFNLFKNTAVIIRQDADDNVEVSPDFDTVDKANHGLSAHVALTGGVVIHADENDHDGKVLTVLERETKKRWQEVEYEVLPTSELEK